MSYQIEAISENDWEVMRELFAVLRSVPSRPIQCAIDRETGNLFVEIANGDSIDPREPVAMDRRCVLIFENRPVLVRIFEPRRAILQASWSAWREIGEGWLNRLNCELKFAVATLYDVLSDSITTKVDRNPYHHIPRDELISGFDMAVNLWFDSRRLKILYRYTDRLIKGKQSFLKWRFYLAKWKGLPKYEKIDAELLGQLAEYFWNPHHLIYLLMHLDEGGERFSEDTKRVLTYIRERHI
ncbi:MAG: hypothetical protein ACYC1F_04865 [Gallionellaceae bacterium]